MFDVLIFGVEAAVSAAIPGSSQAARLPLQFLGAHAPWALEGRAAPAEPEVLHRLVPSDEKSLGTTRRSSLHIWKVRRRRSPVAGIVDAGSQHPTTRKSAERNFTSRRYLMA